MTALNGTAARILALVLLLQAVAYYAVASREDVIPAVPPLSEFPKEVDGWGMARDFPIEKEVQDVLRADDTLSRVYVNPQRTDSASLFIAFFKSQRGGQAPHSPKNCLPGSGWQPTVDKKLPIAVPGRPDPIVVNQYVIERGDDKSVVLYWYQSHNRVIASEFAAKFWLVADAVRYRRSDTALVRIIAAVRNGDTATAAAMAEAFARATYPDVARQLPH
jgi:EpsI family protein